MSIVKLVLDDGEYDMDLDRFMLSEAIALEDDWGLSTVAFAEAVTSGAPPLKVIGAMVWLAKVRHIAAEAGVSFAVAAKTLPVATFDTNLTAIQVNAVEEAPNPTPGVTPTPKARTSRTTSAGKRTKRD